MVDRSTCDGIDRNYPAILGFDHCDIYRLDHPWYYSEQKISKSERGK